MTLTLIAFITLAAVLLLRRIAATLTIVLRLASH